MLRLRFVVPSEPHRPRLHAVAGSPDVTHVARLDGVAREPAGDLVLCDVAREAADHIAAASIRLAVVADGSIAVENVDLELSEAARMAERGGSARRGCDRGPGAGCGLRPWRRTARPY
ncbi:MAG: hypothetical protein ICV70_04065 [Jiangellaceae bacterium]|nr:hypothetical protein [Jiangellaceae bacterium]